ncbi:MAG: YdiU family protein [Natronospirillum sp.]|uniref:protein adenylyltransferase SelO n=1 Tax=Natronospirillum sp. TaxID=2812955 RepID=UPI0025F1B102|nr:YdiU family protein [Natronospirillum sp.]MCH8550349.1 YdiU family protein [Natronospirillum sp.]
MLKLNFDNSYIRLPDQLFKRSAPAAVSDPSLIRVNRTLFAALGATESALDDAELAAVFSGQALLSGADPIAQAYAGHQFGQFVPQLGDGRALLLGEVIDPEGRRFDIQLKGSGRTAFSRGGDGLAPLGPVLREYLVSEAMQALGVPTTRALAAVTTGDRVAREQWAPGAILTRVAASHIRIGTFQYFAAREDHEALDALLQHTLQRHYPEVAESPDPIPALLEAVADRQARLIAHWMSLGFIHGVMNTDNTTLSGETIDYGPCAFMEGYRPEQVFSSIDQGGRYAYRNQPGIAQWNLARLAEALLTLSSNPDSQLEDIREIIADFPQRYELHRAEILRRKLGLASAEDDDLALADDWLALMAADSTDFTLSWRGLANLAQDPAALDELFSDTGAVRTWRDRWLARLHTEGTPADTAAARIQGASPAVIPRNHRVEEAIRAAEDNNDFSVFDKLLAAVTSPFDPEGERSHYGQPAAPSERVYQTFCGT